MVSDFDFIISFSLNNKIFSIQEPLAIYRQHPNQLTRKNFYLQAEQYLNWYKFLKNKIKLKKFTNFNKFLERIVFFEKIMQLKKNKATLLSIIDIFFKGKYKLASKLCFFLIFPNFFIKFIASI